MTSKRRPYGSGSLFKEHGAWYGQWRVDRRLVKRKLGPVRAPGESSGLTKTRAEAVLRKLMAETRIAAPAEACGFDELSARYLTHLRTVRNRKESTLQDYDSMLNRHLLPAFGSRRVDSIKPEHVRALVTTKLGAGLSPKTVNNITNFLHGIMEFAVRTQLLERNPVSFVERPRQQPAREVRFLSKQELEALLAAVPDEPRGQLERLLYLTAALTGLRQGELLALRWRDVDFGVNMVRVRQTYTRGRFGTPKSRRGVRAVPLALRVREALLKHREATVWTTPDDLVFAHPRTGHVLDASRVRKVFIERLERAGLRPVRFHDLRHTYGTHLASAGVPLRTLQEWMGHRDHQTTLIYADYAPDELRAAALVERAFGSDEN